MSQAPTFTRDAVVEIVMAAVQLTRTVQANLVDATREKSDRSPVTIADIGAQALIRHRLKEVAPGVPVLGEEDASAIIEDPSSAFSKALFAQVAQVAPDLHPEAVVAALQSDPAALSAARRFVLDPIDGTKGFLRREHYAVALGFVDDHQVSQGFLACPALSPYEMMEAPHPEGTLMWAARGKGSWQRSLAASGEWQEIKCSDRSDAKQVRLVESVESAHTAHGTSSVVKKLLGTEAESVRLDSQTKYAVVARGDAEAYLRLPTRKDYRERVWDHAAGLIVVEEAGGRVTDVDGKTLDFSHGDKLELNRGVIATNGKVHDRILEVVQEALATKDA